MNCIDVPKADDGEHVSPAVHEALDDPQKRWLVAGICIHIVISPTLREFVKPVFEGIYEALVENKSIDAQAYKPKVTNYPMNNGHKLNYECINNNKAIVGQDRKTKFDYAVRSAVDLSKLFLQTNMCFHTGFDDSCDSSALLTFLINVDDFKSVRSDAQRFKDELRNEWAHCNFAVWTEQKLADSFDLMQDFICSLRLPSDDETKVLNELRDWKTNGQSFLSGSTLGLELVQSLMNHTQKLQTNIQTLAEQTKDEFKEVSATFETINESLLTFEQKFKEIERTLLRHEEDIGRLQERVSSNENCLRSFDTRITNIEKNTSSTAKHSGKKLFQVPHRTEFVGRVDILKQVEDTLGPSAETKKLVLCGLGGIGKTSIAVEYIWNHHAVHYPGGVFWISGESDEAFENSIRCLAAVIGTLGPDPITTHTKTLNWISLRQGRCLVVIDNVDEDIISLPVIRLVKEHNEVIGSYNHLVITTRRSMVKASDDLSCVKCIPVDVMSESESTAFFKRKLGDTNDSDDDIVALCVELQGLPLAIEQATSTIKQLKWTVSGYLREFKKRRIELLSKPLSSNVSHINDINKQSILTTWSLNIENIKKKANMQGLTEAIDLLLPLVARLARDDITTDMFNRGDPRLPNDQVADTFESEYRKLKVVYLFTEYSILTVNSDQTLRIHSLVQDVIRECFKDPVRDLSYVGKCAISMLNMARDLAFKQEDTVLLAKIEKQCAALKMHFENREDVNLDLSTLEIRCQTLTYNITSRKLRELSMVGKSETMQDKHLGQGDSFGYHSIPGQELATTVRGAAGYQPNREVSYRLFRNMEKEAGQFVHTASFFCHQEEIPEQMVDDSFCPGKASLFTQVASFGVCSMKGIGSFFNTPNVRRQNIIGYASFLGINAVAVMVYNILFRK